MYFGEIAALFVVTLGMIPKAIVERFEFKDAEASRRTIKNWVRALAIIALALGFTLLFDYFG